MLMSAYAYVSYKHILVMNEREILLTLLQHYYNMTHLSTSCTLHIQMHRTYTAHATFICACGVMISIYTFFFPGWLAKTWSQIQVQLAREKERGV